MTAPSIAAPQSRATTVLEMIHERIGLIITPIMFVMLGATTVAVWIYSEFDRTTADILEPEKLINQLQAHVNLTFWSTLLVITVAIPLGILLTRPAYRRYSGPVLSLANSGQAIPAYGLIIIFYIWMGRGAVTAVLALTTFAILPVLRNTMVGLDQVDRATIEAARGMGMSKRQTLLRIELPLSVPVILAGVRTALVINVGMAALAFLIGAGGLGEAINAGLKLQRNTAIFISAALVALLALVIDFVAALAERYLRPKGI